MVVSIPRMYGPVRAMAAIHGRFLNPYYRSIISPQLRGLVSGKMVRGFVRLTGFNSLENTQNAMQMMINA